MRAREKDLFYEFFLNYEAELSADYNHWKNLCRSAKSDIYEEFEQMVSHARLDTAIDIERKLRQLLKICEQGRGHI